MCENVSNIWDKTDSTLSYSRTACTFTQYQFLFLYALSDDGLENLYDIFVFFSFFQCISTKYDFSTKLKKLKKMCL